MKLSQSVFFLVALVSSIECFPQRPAILVKDINTDEQTPFSTPGSNPSFKAEMDGILYFVANEGNHGNELWRTDGTEAGTRLVKDIYPGTTGSYISEVVVVNGTLLFAAADPEHGKELWKSNGTAEGTVLIADIFPGAQGSDPQSLVVIGGGAIFFSAHTPNAGREPWRSNGEATGTVLIKDINPGDASSSPSIAVFADASIYFNATTSEYGEELWRSNGQVGNAAIVVDSYSGSQGVKITNLIAFDGKVVFTTIVPLYFENGNVMTSFNWGKLWVVGNTVQAESIFTFGDGTVGQYITYPSAFTYFDHKIYYSFVSPANENLNVLWSTDGTSSGTSPVEATPDKTTNPRAMISFKGYLYFFSSRSGSIQMGRTDGTNNGTTIITDGFSDSGEPELPKMKSAIVNDKLYVTSYFGVWETSESGVSTHLNSNPVNSSFAMGNRLYLSINKNIYGPELYFAESPTPEVMLLKDIMPATRLPGDSAPEKFLTADNNVYFLAKNYGSSNFIYEGVYTTDATANGTVQLVKQKVDNYTVSGETIYFSYGPNIYKKEGDDVSLVKLITGTGGGVYTIDVVEFIPFGNIVFFIVRSSRAMPGSSFGQLWRSDGTTDGTFKISDLFQGDRYLSYSVKKFGNNLVFWSLDGLTKTDGSLAGTSLIKDNSSAMEYNVSMAEVKGILYFATIDGKLWKTDGTSANTALVKNLETYQAGISDLIVVNATLYFVANTTGYGREVWKSDGTEQGTVMVKDISPSNNASIYFTPGPSELVNINDTLYFSADDEIHGFELWKSDGSTEGTVMVEDLMPGPSSSLPRDIQFVNGKVMFLASQADANSVTFVNNSVIYGDAKLWELSNGNAHVVPGDYVMGADLFTADTTVFFSALNGTGRELWTYQVEAKKDIILGVDDEVSRIGAYPNPTSGLLTFEGENTSEPTSFSVLDTNGQVVLHGVTQHGKSQTVDLSSLRSGVYLIRFGEVRHHPVRIVKVD